MIFSFWTPQKYFAVLILFYFVSLHYFFLLDRWLRCCKCQKFTLVYVLFFSFWQDRGKQSIKEISHPIITNIIPWSFWNILSAGNIRDRSGTENFLGVWDSLKVREFSEDPIANRNSSGFRVLLAFRPRTSWPRISKLLQKTKHEASYLYSIIIIIIYWMWVYCAFLKRIRMWAPHVSVV